MHTSLPPDVVHDLVLSLPGHVGVRQDDLDVAPARVVAQPIVDVEAQAVSQPEHERRALQTTDWTKQASSSCYF